MTPLFLNELRSILRDRKWWLIAAAALPALGALDYLAAAHAAANFTESTPFGKIACLTGIYPPVVMAVAYRLFKDINPHGASSAWRTLPVPMRVWAGARYALLASIFVVWPTLLVGAIAALTAPETVTRQCLSVLPALTAACALGAFLGVRQDTVRATVAHAGLLVLNLFIPAWAFDLLGLRHRAHVDSEMNLQIVLWAIAVLLPLWTLHVARRGPSRRRLAAEMAACAALIPFATLAPTAQFSKQPANATDTRVIRFPEVTGELTMKPKNPDEGPSRRSVNGVEFLYFHVEAPELPRVPDRSDCDTTGEWRLIDDSGTATPWRPTQSLYTITPPMRDLPVVEPEFPGDGVRDAMIAGEPERIAAATRTTGTPALGHMRLTLPNDIGGKGRLPYAATKDYFGKTLEVRGVTRCRFTEFSEVMREQGTGTRRVALSGKENWGLKVTRKGNETRVALTGYRMRPWIGRDDYADSAYSRLEIHAALRPDQRKTGHSGSSGGGNSQGLVRRFEIRQSIRIASNETGDTGGISPEAVVVLERTQGATYEVPFHFKIRMRNSF